MTKSADNGPSLTKATYDRKRSRLDPPSPARKKAELDDVKRVAATARHFDKRVTKVGLYDALQEVAPDKFPEKKPGPPHRRI